MNYLDFTSLKTIYKESIETSFNVLEASFHLNEEIILEALRCDAIHIHGRNYETPREELCELLKTPRFDGLVKLTLKELK